MAQQISLDDRLYDLDALNESAKANLQLLQFSDKRLQELKNTIAILQRAKNSYIDSLKAEMLSQKSGFIFDDLE